MKGLPSWPLFAPVRPRATSPVSAEVSSVWSCFLPRVFSRGRRVAHKRLWRQKKAEEKRRILDYDKARRLAGQEALQTGFEFVPDCHFLVIDKPQGLSSYTQAGHIKKSMTKVFESMLKMRFYAFHQRYQGKNGKLLSLRMGKTLKKIKVTGLETLDSFATGVYPIVVEDAIRVAKHFKDGTREYECTVCFGSGTDNQFSSGKTVEEREFSHVTVDAMKEMIKQRFIGELMQVPPMYSTVKFEGRPLHDYAERGRKVDIEPLPVHVYAFEVRRFELPHVRFHVQCDPKTFIRSLVCDLAHALDSCCHVSALRRTRCGVFRIEDAVYGSPESLVALGPKIGKHLIHANQLIPGIWKQPDESSQPSNTEGTSVSDGEMKGQNDEDHDEQRDEQTSEEYEEMTDEDDEDNGDDEYDEESADSDDNTLDEEFRSRHGY
ncbi:tRNA pseudouridine synthase B [Porphyridium purpureum]|uniref:tRNA pseudouridine(55) synthase n=1 Tax=Porphyridium purpureum TaxID=35688 RepID=A0A5J4YMP2_PORPP|nr:tRNA pseudouridine synthase B [Porphyridium purpureum]|eukprot:POR4246..scf244_11